MKKWKPKKAQEGIKFTPINIKDYRYDQEGNIVNNKTGETGTLALPELNVTDKGLYRDVQENRLQKLQSHSEIDPVTHKPKVIGVPSVYPEFDIITLGSGIGPTYRSLKAASPSFQRSMDVIPNKIREQLLNKGIGVKTLPTNRAYRITNRQELDDVVNSGVFREIPEGVTVPNSSVTIKTSSGRSFRIGKKRGNSHGGKAFSAGQPWTGQTVAGSEDKVILSVPLNDTPFWYVGHHGNYKIYPSDEVIKGKGLWMPFNKETRVVNNLDINNLKVFKRRDNGKYYLDK